MIDISLMIGVQAGADDLERDRIDRFLLRHFKRDVTALAMVPPDPAPRAA